MNYIKEYLKIISYLVMGIVFSFSAFYLLINVFHSLEISKLYPINTSNQAMITEYDRKIRNIESKIATFNSSTYQGEVSTLKMLKIQQNLKQCATILKATYLEDIRNKETINITDVYLLRDSYENKILSDCIINNLYWTTSLKDNQITSTYLENNQTMLKLYVDSLKKDTSYLKKDLLNNSSYFFNTDVASSEIKNNVRDGFYETLDAYYQACSYVEFLSEWFYNEVGAK